MNTLTIKLDGGQTASFYARLMLGTPAEMGALYVLLASDGTDDGKSHPASVEITEGKDKKIFFFDCIEVEDNVAFGYVYLSRERSGRIGELLSLS